jgi:hypothetical protein
MAIWKISGGNFVLICYIFPGLVSRTKKNLATLAAEVIGNCTADSLSAKFQLFASFGKFCVDLVHFPVLV